MNEKELYIKMVTNVLEGLKCECKKFECCSTECDFYIHSSSECLLKQCPCDYDIDTIRNSVSNLFEKEMK